MRNAGLIIILIGCLVFGLSACTKKAAEKTEKEPVKKVEKQPEVQKPKITSKTAQLMAPKKTSEGIALNVLQARTLRGKTNKRATEFLRTQADKLKECCSKGLSMDQKDVNFLSQVDLADDGSVVHVIVQSFRASPKEFQICIESQFKSITFPPNRLSQGVEPFPRSFKAAMVCKLGGTKEGLKIAPKEEQPDAALKVEQKTEN